MKVSKIRPESLENKLHQLRCSNQVKSDFVPNFRNGHSFAQKVPFDLQSLAETKTPPDMTHYTTLNDAIDRINRAIMALDADIKEWSLVKSSLFGKNVRRPQNTQEKELRTEFDTFLNRSKKVKENLVVFKNLFDTISVN
jgi:hypothetical protein